jgi:hypothetical protein
MTPTGCDGCRSPRQEAADDPIRRKHDGRDLTGGVQNPVFDSAVRFTK